MIHFRIVVPLRERMAALPMGPGIDPHSQVGPVIDADGCQRIAAAVAEAEACVARVTLGSRRASGAGYFFAPTVLTGVSADDTLATNEIFGPVAAFASYPDEDAMLAAANATTAGLVAFAYTRDLGRALRVGEA